MGRQTKHGGPPLPQKRSSQGGQGRAGPLMVLSVPKSAQAAQDCATQGHLLVQTQGTVRKFRPQNYFTAKKQAKRWSLIQSSPEVGLLVHHCFESATTSQKQLEAPFVTWRWCWALPGYRKSAGRRLVQWCLHSETSKHFFKVGISFEWKEAEPRAEKNTPAWSHSVSKSEQ